MTSGQTKYERVAEDLRSQIAEGKYGAGAKLPSESELTAEYGYARSVIRQALSVLTSDGLIRSEGAQGHFVRGEERIRYRPQQEWRPQPEYPEMDRFMADWRDRNPSQVISVEIAAAPPTVAERLGLGPEDLVAIRRRVRSLDGVPWNINDSYYPLDVVQGSEIMNPTDVARGTNQVLTDLGFEQVRAIDEIEVRMPVPDEVSRLKLSPGTPVALHRVTGYTKADKPVRCTLNVLPGPTHVIAFERTKPA